MILKIKYPESGILLNNSQFHLQAVLRNYGLQKVSTAFMAI